MRPVLYTAGFTSEITISAMSHTEALLQYPWSTVLGSSCRLGLISQFGHARTWHVLKM